MEHKYYVAYGSNLDKHAMSKYRCPTATPVGKGELKNMRLVFRGDVNRSYLTVEPAKGATVPVGIWEINQEEEKHLDYYEGYPFLYRKENIRVNVDESSVLLPQNIEGLIYIMNDGYPENVPSINYIDTCYRGYEDFGLNTDILSESLASARLATFDRSSPTSAK